MKKQIISSTSPPRKIGVSNHVLVWFIGAVATCIIALAYAGTFWPMALYRICTDGLLALAWLGAAVGWGSLVPLDWSRSRRVFSLCTAAGLGFGSASLLFLGLGLAGWLNTTTAWLWLALGVVLAIWRIWQIARQRTEDVSTGRTYWPWFWLIVIQFAAITIVAALLPPGVMWGDEPNGYDVVEYHLQIPREWYEAGRIMPLEHNVFSFFPFNMEMHYLLAMHLRGGPWAGMYLAQLMHVAFAVLTIAAIYGAVRASADVGAATISGIAAATVPWMTLLAPVAYNECALLFFGTLAVAWMLESLRSERWLSAALLAGAFAGFACGAKLTGAPLLLAGVPVAAGAVWIIHRFVRGDALSSTRLLAACAVFIVAGVICFAPWLLRNLIWTGNPVFPEGTEIFGAAHFSQTQVERWNRAHAPRSDQQSIVSRIGAARRQLLFEASSKESIIERLRYSYLPIILLGMTAFAVSFRRLESQFLLSLFCFLLVFWLSFTHLQGRFFVLAIPILALLLGQVSTIKMRATACIVIVIAGVLGAASLHARLMSFLYFPSGERKVVVLLGSENISLLAPPAAENLSVEAHLALVGDARAFFYPRPMSRLSYRTVFDVDAKNSNELIEKWSEGAPAGAAILVDPNELRRFSRTYWKIPPPPREIELQREPFIFQK